MSGERTIEWPGESGTSYKYWIHPIGTSFKESSGNYMFAKEVTLGRWAPVYIGQTDDLSTRLSNHPKELCAKRNGATHVHAHLNGTEADRLVEEKDLIAKWQPPCNA
jgi:hypothetical protein